MIEAVVFRMQLVDINGDEYWHPYHLGTDEAVAVNIAMTMLAARCTPNHPMGTLRWINLYRSDNTAMPHQVICVEDVV